MNIVHLIGNGFDLNLGMESRYSDFYKYYQSYPVVNPSLVNLKREISANIVNWSDLEIALGRYTEKLNSVSEVDEVLEDIGDKLAEYLQQEEDKLDLSLFKADKLFTYLAYPESSLLKADKDEITSFKQKWSNYQWNVNVITFNYTRTLEKIIGEQQKKIILGSHHGSASTYLIGIEHIHGYTDERMIIGVNDVSQIKNAAFHTSQDAIEAIIKTDCNKALKHKLDQVCRSQISNSNLICIFGSSIGDTDNIWWELIGEQLKRDNFKLIIYSKGEEVPKRIIQKQARGERKIKEFFLKKTNLTDEEKENVKDKIFIGLNTEMFNLL